MAWRASHYVATGTLAAAALVWAVRDAWPGRHPLTAPTIRVEHAYVDYERALGRAETLSGLGFALIGGRAQLDLDKAALDTDVQNFGRQIQGADVALFYYAGHGVQVNGSNYLVPVGANPTREADVDFQMVDINLVLRQMEASGTRLISARPESSAAPSLIRSEPE